MNFWYSSRHAALAIVASCAASMTAAHAAIITNGSFGDTTNLVDNTGQDTMSLDVGSMAMTGWTVIGQPIAWIGPSNPFAFSASDGNYSLDLTGYHQAPFGGVQQTISTTAGYSSEVTFDLGSSQLFGYPVGLTVSAAGGSQTFTTTGTPGDSLWQPESYNFVANSATTTLSFLGASGSNSIGLDNVNVSVSAVPLTGAAGMFGSALLGLMGVAGLRRRKNAAAGLG